MNQPIITGIEVVEVNMKTTFTNCQNIDVDSTHSVTDSEDDASTVGQEPLVPPDAPVATAADKLFVCRCNVRFRRKRDCRRKNHLRSRTHSQWVARFQSELEEAFALMMGGGVVPAMCMENIAQDSLETSRSTAVPPSPPVELSNARPSVCKPSPENVSPICDAPERVVHGGEDAGGGTAALTPASGTCRGRECKKRLVAVDYREKGLCRGCWRRFCKTEKKKIRPRDQQALWDTYFGNVRFANCLGDCDKKRMDVMAGGEWHASHIYSEASGAGSHLNNLLPMCAGCNLRTGTDKISDEIVQRYEDLRLQRKNGVAPDQILLRIQKLIATGVTSVPVSYVINKDQWLAFEAGQKNPGY